MNYILRALAAQDLEEIWLYTLGEWDMDQADEYLAAIMSRFEWLSSHLELGRDRGGIGEGFFSFPQGQHLIFYRITNGLVDVIRILHHSMDVHSHLDAEDER